MTSSIRGSSLRVEAGPLGVFASTAVVIAAFTLGATAYTAMYVVQPMFGVFSDVFDISSANASAGLSATTLCFALSAPIATWMSSKYGRLSVMTVGTIFIIVGCLLSGGVEHWWQMLAARSLVGMGLATIPGVIVGWIHETLAPHSVSRIVGSYVSGTVMGGMVGRLLGGWATELVGWRGTLTLMGMSALLLLTFAIGVLYFAARRSKKSVSARGVVVVGREASPSSIDRKPWRLRLFFIGASSVGLFVGAFNVLVFVVRAEPYGLGPGPASLFFLTFILGVVIAPRVMSMASAVGPRRLLISCVVGIGLGTLLLRIPNIGAVIVAVTLISAAFFVVHSLCTAWLAIVAERPSSAQGSYVLWYYIGSSLGGLAATFAWDIGHWIGFWIWQLCVVALTLLIAAGLPRYLEWTASGVAEPA